MPEALEPETRWRRAAMLTCQALNQAILESCPTLAQSLGLKIPVRTYAHKEKVLECGRFGSLAVEDSLELVDSHAQG